MRTDEIAWAWTVDQCVSTTGSSFVSAIVSSAACEGGEAPVARSYSLIVCAYNGTKNSQVGHPQVEGVDSLHEGLPERATGSNPVNEPSESGHDGGKTNEFE